MTYKGTDVCTLLSGSAGTQQGCKQECPHLPCGGTGPRAHARIGRPRLSHNDTATLHVWELASRGCRVLALGHGGCVNGCTQVAHGGTGLQQGREQGRLNFHIVRLVICDMCPCWVSQGQHRAAVGHGRHMQKQAMSYGRCTVGTNRHTCSPR